MLKDSNERQLTRTEDISLDRMSPAQKKQVERLYSQLGLGPVVSKVLKEFSNSLSGMDRVTDRVFGPYDVKGRADAVARVTAFVTYAALGEQDNKMGTDLLASLAQDIWRLQAAVQRSSDAGQIVAESVSTIVDRLRDDLDAGGVQIIAPKGQEHDSGAGYEVAYIEPDGEGKLFVSETLSPGVKVGDRMLAMPTVVLRRGGIS